VLRYVHAGAACWHAAVGRASASALTNTAPVCCPPPRAERGPRRRQVGKSGASWIAQALLLALGSIAAALPIIAAIFAAVIAAWLGAVRHLNAQMEARYT